MINDSNSDIIDFMIEKNLIIKREFILKSGLKSTYYFDFKGAISYPSLINKISKRLNEFIEDDNACITGVPFGGIPYSLMISQMRDMPMIFVREEDKKHGLHKIIEGENFGKEVIIIEDVITTGMSIYKTIDILRSHDVKIRQIICILDRKQGGVEKLKADGFRVDSLMSCEN